MRQYEIVYILDPSLARDTVDGKLAAFHEALGGEVTAVDHWGVRPLAYPIGKLRTACYVVVQVTADPVGLPEFERLVKLDEETLRHLLVLNEGLSTSGDSILAQRPSEEPGDDADGPGDGAGADSGGDGESGGQEDGGQASSAQAGTEGGVDGTDAAENDGGADADGGGGPEGDSAGDGDAADTGAPAHAAPETSPTAPPVFSGPRGRRRRHDGPPIVLLNYKDVTTLSRFLTDQGKILPKRTTKVTARFQRQLGTAVKRARHIALLPYVRDHEA